MKRICTFLLLIAAIVSSVSADNGLYDGKYDRPTHFPDFQRPTGWPNNMSIFVQAMTAGGDTVFNYEVAVYDQENKLRAIGRSRTADKQKCMLTVFGQEGDHVHCFVSAPPKLSVTDIVKYLKGITGRKLFEQFPGIREKLWKGQLWNHSYYVETIGSVSEENIRRYIEKQSKSY